MAVDYDLFEGRRRTAGAHDARARHDGLGRRQILTQPGHGRFVRRATYGGTD